MKIFNNFSVYTPDEAIKDVIYCQDENKVDWYSLQQETDYNLAIVYDASGKIFSASNEISSLTPPIEMNVCLMQTDQANEIIDSFEYYNFDADTGTFIYQSSLAKQEKLDELNEACRQSIIAGFSSSALGEEHFYKYTLEDQANLQAALSLAKESGGGQLLKCSDGNGLSEYKEHSLEQLQRFFVDAEAHKMGCLTKAYELKRNI